MWLSILRNEFIWSVAGVHDLDDNGHAKIAQEHVKIQYHDNDTLQRVGNIVMTTRIKNYGLYFEQELRMEWVREPTSLPSLYTQCTLLEEVKADDFVHYIKSPDFELSDKKQYLLACEIDRRNIPMKPKYKNKTKEIDYKKPIIETIDEVLIQKVFDEDKQKHVLKMTKTGKQINVHKKEVLPLYDIDGNYVEDREVEMYDTELHDLQEIENDVMIPIYEVKQIGETRFFLLPCIKFK